MLNHIFLGKQLSLLGLPDNCDRIAVAVSGGSDSMALTLLAHQWSLDRSVHIIALTVDHALRSESTKEAQEVHSTLSNLGIEHHTLVWNHNSITGNIQSQARQARYDLMSQWCKEHSISFLLTAHQQEDQAETILLRLLRGSGVDGMAGIPLRSQWAGITILRPLLHESKAALRQYLIDHALSWIDDPSNDNDRFDRVKIRKFFPVLQEQIAPASLSKRLCDHAMHMARVSDYLEEETAKASDQCVTISTFGYASLNLMLYQQMHLEIQYRLLQQLLMTISGDPHIPRFDKLDRLHTSFTASSFDQSTLHGCIINRQDDHLYVLREPQAVTAVRGLCFQEPFYFDNRFTLSLDSKNIGIFDIVPLAQVSLLGHESLKLCYDNLSSLPGRGLKHHILGSCPVIMTLEKVVAVPHIGFYMTPIDDASCICQFNHVYEIVKDRYC